MDLEKGETGKTRPYSTEPNRCTALFKTDKTTTMTDQNKIENIRGYLQSPDESNVLLGLELLVELVPDVFYRVFEDSRVLKNVANVAPTAFLKVLNRMGFANHVWLPWFCSLVSHRPWTHRPVGSFYGRKHIAGVEFSFAVNSFVLKREGRAPVVLFKTGEFKRDEVCMLRKLRGDKKRIEALRRVFCEQLAALA